MAVLLLLDAEHFMLMAPAIDKHVIANQCARWCGNLLWEGSCVFRRRRLPRRPLRWLLAMTVVDGSFPIIQNCPPSRRQIRS